VKSASYDAPSYAVFSNLLSLHLEGLAQLKNPMTSSGIEPATFRLAAECLNRLKEK
jgi:hypothetical protein